MDIQKHFDKNNLHHAYLIEGGRDEIIPEIFKFCEKIGIKTAGNPDFCHISIDNFKIEAAFDLRAMSGERGYSEGKKIYLLCANIISLDAQNVLLKMFEEPVENTHFFVVGPETNSLLKTLVSRFYAIKNKNMETSEEAEEFIKMSMQKRIDFISELLPKKDKESEDAEDISTDSNRTKALKFLNTLESALHSRLLKNSSGFTLPGVPGGTYAANNFLATGYNHIFKVREFLRMPGSSAKNLLESVALIVPIF